VNDLTINAPAKINLCLTVLGKRPDGYHDVEMLMQAIALYDVVTVRLTDAGITVSCGSPGVPEGQGNIAWRAARAMLDLSRSESGISVDIRKRIPVAAGLGGGSSDAAAVLVACNRLLGLGFDRERLAAVGAELGMDVPFFLFGPTALARGRGEILAPVPPPPKFWVLLVNPGFETSTAWAYKNLNLELTKRVDCTNIAGLAVDQIAAALHNDLETVTATAHPAIEEMEQALRKAGALGACMSGSGPTVFGMFATEFACRAAAEELRSSTWRLYPAEILTGPLYGEPQATHP
jgi:4-diphosphocytidyl-2-C-methyl-D-erythritol kinase